MGLLSSLFKVIGVILKPLKKVFDFLAPDIKQDTRAIQVMREGSNHSIPVVYGRQKAGGIIVHKYVTDREGGAKNDTLNLIVAFAEGEIEGIEELFFDDVSENDPKFRKTSLDPWLKINKHLGVDGEQADSDAVANIPNWTNDHKMSGLAYCYIQLIIDKDQKIWRGEPQITAIIRGKKILDTRTSVTAFNTNPAMCLRDYLLNPIYGKGLDASRIDEAAFVSAANFCDSTVTATETLSRSYYDRETNQYINLAPGTMTSQIKRFTANIIVDTGQDIFNNTKRLLGTFRGIMPPDYVLSPKIEKEESVIDVITEEDIIGPVNFGSGGITDRYNRVTVKYNAKNSKYEKEEAFYPADDDPIYQTWLDEDGGRELEKTFTFDGIDNKAEALQMAAILARRSRFTGALSLSMQARGIQYQVGDVIGVDNYTMGWESKPFRVREKTLAPTGEVSLALSEHENSAYPWSSVSYEDREGGTFLGEPTEIDAPTDLQLTLDGTLATTGELTWQSTDDAFIEQYRVSIAKQGVTIIQDNTRGKSYTVPLLDIGDYAFTVYAISTLGTLSPAATLAATLAIPATPTSITLVARDFEIDAFPVLAGFGLGTTFEYDYALGDGAGYTPEPKAKGASFTLTGLIPLNEYTIFARSINPLGVSGWVSATATTTATGTQLEPFLGPIQQEIDDANDKIESLEFGEEALTFQDLMDSVSQGVFGEFDNFQRIEDITSEERIRKQQFEQTSAEIDSVNGNLNSAVTRIDQVEVLADGNATALSILDTRVTNNDSNISANATNIQAVSLQSNGNATAINALEARVDSNEDFASAQLVLNAEYESDIDTVSARAFLGVDINNRVTGINIQGEPANTVIDFIADKVRFIRPTDSSVALRWSAVDNELVLDGKIIARDSTFTGTVTASVIQGTTINGGTINASAFFGGTFDGGTFTGNTFIAGTIKGAKIEMIGTNFMKVQSATPFGPNNLIEWYGPKSGNISGQDPIYNNLTKVNAITYLGDDGSAYFGGTIIAGTLTTAKATSDTGTEIQVNSGVFGSNGGQIAIACSLSSVAASESTGVCPSLPSPSVQIRLYEVVGGVNQLVKFDDYAGSYACTQEGGQAKQEWEVSGSFTFFDNQLSTSNRQYILQATLSNMGVDNRSQRLSIVTQEA